MKPENEELKEELNVPFCPICKAVVLDDQCDHLLAYLDITFKEFIGGKAEKLFSEYFHEKEVTHDAFSLFNEACKKSTSKSENTSSPDSISGFTSAESVYWADDIKKSLEKLRLELKLD
jgi:hypothetical protein